MGEVLRAEAVIRRNAGDWDGALQSLRASLAMARVSGDLLLQAGDLVDLGYVSLQSGRYDQAVLLSQEAAQFAVSVQAGRQIPMALGNLGGLTRIWATLKARSAIFKRPNDMPRTQG